MNKHIEKYYREQIKKDRLSLVIFKNKVIDIDRREELFGMQTKEVNEDIIYINTIK